MADMKPVGIDQTTGQQRPIASGDTLNTGSEIEIVIKNRGDYLGVAPTVHVQYPWDTPTRLDDPTTFPVSFAGGVAWSPGGEYVAFYNNDTGAKTWVYQRNGNNFNQLAFPATQPSTTTSGLEFSPDGELICFGGNSTSGRGFTTYQLSGNTLTLLPEPASQPTSGSTNGLAFSPTGELLALAAGSQGLLIYRRNGTSFTKLADPASVPGGFVYNCTWSPDGQFLAIGGDTAPRVHIYQRSGLDELTLLVDAASSPGTQIRNLKFSNNGRFLATANYSTGDVIVFERNGTTFTTADTISIGGAFSLDWSPNDRYLAVGAASGDRARIFERDGTTFTALTSPASQPVSIPYCAWSPDGQFLTYNDQGSGPPSRAIFYQTTGTLPTSGVVKTVGIQN